MPNQTTRNLFTTPDEFGSADLEAWLLDLAQQVENALGFKIRLYSGTTDATGYLTTTHGLGFTPGAVFAQNRTVGTSFAECAGTSTITSTTFQTRWYDARGGAGAGLANQAVDFVAICYVKAAA